MNEPIKKSNQTNPEGYSPKTPKMANIIIEARNGINYPEEFILPDKSTKIPPEIKHYGPAYECFANEFAHFFDYSGQGYGFLYEGDWCKDRGYVIADIYSGHAMEPSCLRSLEGIDSLWKTAGFPAYQKFYANPDNDSYMSKSEMKEAIKYGLCSLEQPVIVPIDIDEYPMFGSIVIGYKDNGNVIICYGYVPYFRDMENNAQPKIIEVSNWYNEDTTLLIAGKREKVLSLKYIYQKGFLRIRDCFDKNIRGDKRHIYEEWGKYLRLDALEMIAETKRTRTIPGGEDGLSEESGNDNEIWKCISNSYNNTWCIMSESRYYVMHFFRQAKAVFPDFTEDLQALEDHLGYTSNIMGNQETGYNSEIGDPVNSDILKEPDVRERMADCVRRFKEAEAKGLEMLEVLLEKFNKS